MIIYIIIASVLLVVGCVVFFSMRSRLENVLVDFDDDIRQTLSFPDNKNLNTSLDSLNQENFRQFEDIETALNGMFQECFVSGTDETAFVERFTRPSLWL